MAIELFVCSFPDCREFHVYDKGTSLAALSAWDILEDHGHDITYHLCATHSAVLYEARQANIQRYMNLARMEHAVD